MDYLYLSVKSATLPPPYSRRQVMGKGDKKTRKGKIRTGSFGNSRPRKKSSEIPPVTAGKKVATKKQVAKSKPASKPKVSPKAKADPKKKA